MGEPARQNGSDLAWLCRLHRIIHACGLQTSSRCKSTKTSSPPARRLGFFRCTSGKILHPWCPPTQSLIFFVCSLFRLAANCFLRVVFRLGFGRRLRWRFSPTVRSDCSKAESRLSEARCGPIVGGSRKEDCWPDDRRFAQQ